MSAQTDKATQFRTLHVPGKPLVLFNCWDAGSARAIVAGGAPALATASWAVAAANGYEDGEHVPFDFVIANLARIVRAVELPVSVDLETGYGVTPDAVGASVEHAILAGAVGCNLEDGDFKGGSRSAAAHGERIKAARSAAERQSLPLFINARTDAFLFSKPETHTADMVAEAIARANIYADHGADGLFVPGLVDSVLIEHLVRASPLPINLMASDALPGLAGLGDLGVARLSYGPRPYLRAMDALTQAAKSAFAG